MKSTPSRAFAEDLAALSKEELEKLKIRLEIEELDRPFWRKPAHLYTLLAICSLSVAFLTGRFQADSTRLDTEKAILAYRTDEFEAKRAPVQKELEQTVRDRDNYRSQLDATRIQLASASQEVTSTKQELSSVKQALEFRKEMNSTKTSLPFLTMSNVAGKPATKTSGTLPRLSYADAIRLLKASAPKNTIRLPQLQSTALKLEQLGIQPLTARPNISPNSLYQLRKGQIRK